MHSTPHLIDSIKARILIFSTFFSSYLKILCFHFPGRILSNSLWALQVENLSIKCFDPPTLGRKIVRIVIIASGKLGTGKYFEKQADFNTRFLYFFMEHWDKICKI